MPYPSVPYPSSPYPSLKLVRITVNTREISPWAYFRENTVIKLTFNLNYIKGKKCHLKTIN